MRRRLALTALTLSCTLALALLVLVHPSAAATRASAASALAAVAPHVETLLDTNSGASAAPAGDVGALDNDGAAANADLLDDPAALRALNTPWNVVAGVGAIVLFSATARRRLGRRH